MKGTAYNVVSLASQRLLKQLLLPPVSTRVAALCSQLEEMQQFKGLQERQTREQELLQLPEEFGGYGLLTQLFADPHVGPMAQQLALQRQLLGLDVRMQQQQQQQEGTISFVWRDTLHEGPSAAQHAGVFAALSGMTELKQRLPLLLRQLAEQQKPLKNNSKGLMLLSLGETPSATPEAIAADVAAAAAEAAATDAETANALTQGLETLRLLIPNGTGDVQQIALLPKHRQESPSIPDDSSAAPQLQEDLLQRSAQETGG